LTIEHLQLSIASETTGAFSIRHSRYLPAFFCIALLVLFESLTMSAVRSKSPTFDEPIHAMAASVALNTGDFRMDYDNPPLWKYWAALPTVRSPIHFDPNDSQWQRIPHELSQQWTFMIRTLYRQPNDPDRLIDRARWMMSLFAVAIGTLVAVWSWRIAGPAAAVIATFLFALDPNFIGHGALVKNDAIMALLFLALAYTCFRLGQKITVTRLLTVGLICGAGCSVKFSGVVLPIVAALLIILRAVQSPWDRLQTSAQRLLGTFAMLIVVGLLTATVIWASYGFRFSVSPDPSVKIDTQRLVDALAQRQTPPGAPLDSWSPPITVRVTLWGLRHRLLPEPWWNGLLYIYVGTQSRPAFLLGQARQSGPWAFYSLAMLVKTPLATLAAVALALWGISRKGNDIDRWTTYCLMLPPLIYSLFVITGPAAAGLRHVLVLYPFLFIAIGLATAKLLKHIVGKWIIGAIALGLAAETLAAFPNYIAFFNLAAGGSRNGIHLLGDSNLDWGQDLPLLAQWQHNHPDHTLYLSYFGTADPAHYGIHYLNLPGGELFGPAQLPTTPSVIAISATNLQGIYPAKDFNLQTLYAPLRNAKPIDVLGGSIYLFDYPLSDGAGLH
jgi:hypothetical protein